MSIADPVTGFRLPVEVKVELPFAPPGSEWPAESPQQRTRWDGFLSALQSALRKDREAEPPDPRVWERADLRIVARITIRPPRGPVSPRGEYNLPEIASRVGSLLIGPPPGFVSGIGRIVRFDLSVIESHPDAPEGFFMLDLASPDWGREWMEDERGDESETGNEVKSENNQPAVPGDGSREEAP